MKRVRCPKCDNYIIFDETKYKSGQSLVFQCPLCSKEFGIRLGVSKIRNTQDEENPDQEAEENETGYGSIVVIENAFHYKQVIPLHFGKNVIGRYMKGNDINCPIETGDLNIDMTHCILTVCKDKKAKLKYILQDGPSYTGTFVGFERLKDREKRVISDNTLFTISATSLILHTANHKDE